MYDRSNIVCYCKPSGGTNSICTMQKDPSAQKLCGFYEKSRFLERCTNLKFDEYCHCFHACDFASGLDVLEKFIINMPPTSGQVVLDKSQDSEYVWVDTLQGRMKVRKDGRRILPNTDDLIKKYRTSMEKLIAESGMEDVVVKGYCSGTEFYGVGPIEDKTKESHEDRVKRLELAALGGPTESEKKQMIEDAENGDRSEAAYLNMLEQFPMIDVQHDFSETTWRDHSAEDLVKTAEFYYKMLKDRGCDIPEKNPCCEEFWTADPQLVWTPHCQVDVDNSGSLTREQFAEAIDGMEDENTRLGMVWNIEVDPIVTVGYIRDIMEGMCGAYDEKFRLYLDMSNPNMYTIYKANGHIITLRELYRDGIFPMDLDFKMIDGTKQEDLDFVGFLDMVPEMVHAGR